MIPTKEVQDDKENIDKLTELIAVQSHRISEPFLEYLRTTMTNHYQEIDGQDSQYLMISSPRVLKFEMLILEWGLKVLKKISKDELYSRSTLDEDKEAL